MEKYLNKSFGSPYRGDQGAAWVASVVVMVAASLIGGIIKDILITPYWMLIGFLLCCLWRAIGIIADKRITRSELLTAFILGSMLGPLTMFPMSFAIFASCKASEWFSKETRFF